MECQCGPKVPTLESGALCRLHYGNIFYISCRSVLLNSIQFLSSFLNIREKVTRLQPLVQLVFATFHYYVVRCEFRMK